MNILILSAGTRNKIVQYFVKTLNGTGKVIATDMSNLDATVLNGYSSREEVIVYVHNTN